LSVLAWKNDWGSFFVFLFYVLVGVVLIPDGDGLVDDHIAHLGGAGYMRVEPSRFATPLSRSVDASVDVECVFPVVVRIHNDADGDVE